MVGHFVRIQENRRFSSHHYWHRCNDSRHPRSRVNQEVLLEMQPQGFRGISTHRDSHPPNEGPFPQSRGNQGPYLCRRRQQQRGSPPAWPVDAGAEDPTDPLGSYPLVRSNGDHESILHVDVVGLCCVGPDVPSTVSIEEEIPREGDAHPSDTASSDCDSRS